MTEETSVDLDEPIFAIKYMYNEQMKRRFLQSGLENFKNNLLHFEFCTSQQYKHVFPLKINK